MSLTQRDPLQAIIMSQIAEENGIMPMIDNHDSVKKHFDSFSKKESQKMKRKFRKLWRKLSRGIRSTSDKEYYGIGNLKPSQIQCSRRRYLVWVTFVGESANKRSKL